MNRSAILRGGTGYAIPARAILLMAQATGPLFLLAAFTAIAHLCAMPVLHLATITTGLLILCGYLLVRGMASLARHGDVEGVLTLSLALGLLMLAGPVGLIATYAVMGSIWIAFPPSIRPSQWLHACLPIAFPAVLVAVVRTLVGAAQLAGEVLPGTVPTRVFVAVSALAVGVVLMAAALGQRHAIRHRRARAGLPHHVRANLALATAMIAAVLAVDWGGDPNWHEYLAILSVVVAAATLEDLMLAAVKGRVR